MNEHEILQSFRHNSDGTWTPLKVVAVQGVNMQSGVLYFREVWRTAELMWLHISMTWQNDILFPCATD